MGKMAEIQQEVKNRLKYTVSILRDATFIVSDNWEDRGSDFTIDKDRAAELEDTLWYAIEHIRHDILPLFEIEVDECGRVIDEEE